MADGTMFKLWSVVIFVYWTREVIDLDSMKKFKDIKSWKLEKNG